MAKFISQIPLSGSELKHSIPEMYDFTFKTQEEVITKIKFMLQIDPFLWIIFIKVIILNEVLFHIIALAIYFIILDYKKYLFISPPFYVFIIW